MESKNFGRYALSTLVFLVIENTSFAAPGEDKDLVQARLLYQNAATDEAITLCTEKIAAGKNLAQWHEMYAKALNLRRNGSANASLKVARRQQFCLNARTPCQVNAFPSVIHLD